MMSMASKFTSKSGPPKRSGSMVDQLAQKRKPTAEKASFQDQLGKSRADCLYLCKGLDKGRAAWYYVMVDKPKIPIFLKQYETPGGTINLLDYGEVVYSGWGEEPPEDIKKKVEEEYG